MPHGPVSDRLHPNVTFGFNAKGAAAFQTLTRTLAHRGDLISKLGQALDQHARSAPRIPPRYAEELILATLYSDSRD